MKMAISQGLTDLNEIKRMYDASIPNIEASSVNNTYSSVPYNPSPKDVRYDDGGRLAEVIITPNRDYNIFLNSLPPNQKYGDSNFNTYRYWELHGKPANFEAALKTNPPMYTLEDDGYYHARSVAYNRDNDTYEFMKSPDHPTVDLELLQYWNNPDLEEFRSNYGLDLDSNPYKYIRRETTNKPLYAYGGPLGNIYKGTGNKSQKLSKAERENRAMWAKGQPFYKEMSLWNTGLSDVALAGILGNMGLESGFDYKATNGTHHGYLQNQDSIRDYIKKYYGGYGHKEQMQYLRDGLTGKLKGRDSSIGKQMQARFDGYIKAVANVTDPMVASQLWEQHYERSRGQAMGKRQRYAKYFYEQLTPQEKQELAQQMISSEVDYNTRFARQLAADPNFLYLDPNMSFFDALTKAGVHFKTSNPSGYRSPARQKAMGFKTKDSQHSHKRDDGTAWALDIVPAKGYTFADLQRELTHPALQVYFRNNGLGVYDETTQEVLAKTGGTDPHYHVGRNKFGPKGSMAITYNNWIKKYNPALPEAYKMPIDLVEVSPEQSVYHHPANDLVWNPPTTEITPEDLNREIAPLLMQNNKPLIVEPLNNSEPSKSFDDIWDQIFPKVENTQEEFNPLLDPSTQFTALQSRPRYQMKPTPIINMPISNGDNDYMLFKPLAKGGNLFGDGSFMIKQLPKGYVEAYPNMKVTTPSGQSVPLSEGYEKWGNTVIGSINDVPHLTDFLLQESTKQPQTPKSKPLSWLTDDQMFYLSNLAMSIAWGGRDAAVDRRRAAKDYPIGGPAQATYLLPRDVQENKFLEFGYQLGKDGDYGLVKRAVGDSNLPIYQRWPDDINREDLIVIGNSFSDPQLNDIWRKYGDFGLQHAGHYPTAYYLGAKDHAIYGKAWDLNDYGGGTGASKRYGFFERMAADLLDKVGSPVVVTTGFKKLNDDSLDWILSTPELKATFEKALGLHFYPAEYYKDSNGNLQYQEAYFGGPEITITP